MLNEYNITLKNTASQMIMYKGLIRFCQLSTNLEGSRKRDSRKLLLEDRMFVVCAATEGHDEVRGPSSHWQPCESPWSMLLLPVMRKEATVAVVPTTPDSEVRIRDIEGFCNNSSVPQKCLGGRPMKRALKIFEKDAEM